MWITLILENWENKKKTVVRHLLLCAIWLKNRSINAKSNSEKEWDFNKSKYGLIWKCKKKSHDNFLSWIIESDMYNLLLLLLQFSKKKYLNKLCIYEIKINEV